MLHKTLSTSQVARLLDVSDQSVANWIDQGKLRAGKTPGGHRRIVAEDLLEFARRQQLRIPPELGRAALTVLIVDGDCESRILLTEGLRTNEPHWRVLSAGDGFTAGEIVTAERPEVVVIDVGMRGLDCAEVCRSIKSRRRAHPVTLLALATNLSAALEQAVCQAGADVCLAKPIDARCLRNHIVAARKGTL